LVHRKEGINICGIFGATSAEKFLELYDLNKGRGDYAYGGLYIRKGELYQIDKRKGTPDLQKEDLPWADWYLGHLRAPTSNVTMFRYDNSHPFTCNEWIVAHNGILSNFNQLKVRYLYNGDVDSSIIPVMLSARGSLGVLDQLQGTFGIWAYNAKTDDIFLARCASSIWFDEGTGAFSSVQFEGSQMLKEGVIKRLTTLGVSDWGTFPFKSPYFIPE
jgi:glucosamine 6-phosphate synthetase-like amidotransferase/phosphosugar isomerase protein